MARNLCNRMQKCLYSFNQSLFFLDNLQALVAIPSVNSDVVQQRLDRVRTYYELLNMPFEVSCLISFLKSRLNH